MPVKMDEFQTADVKVDDVRGYGFPPLVHSPYVCQTKRSISSVLPGTHARTIWTAMEHGSPLPIKNANIMVREKYDGVDTKRYLSTLRGHVNTVPNRPSTRGRSRGMTDLK